MIGTARPTVVNTLRQARREMELLEANRDLKCVRVRSVGRISNDALAWLIEYAGMMEGLGSDHGMYLLEGAQCPLEWGP